MDNIILIGFMGSGKSTIANYIEENYEYKKVSIDDFIVEQSGMSIENIFNVYGEKYFRKLETDAINKIVENIKNSNERYIIDCGGGSINSQSFYKLKTIGKVFFVDVSIDEIIERLKNDATRPLAKDKEKLSKLYNERYEKYCYLSDVIISNQELYENNAKIIVETIKKS